MRLLVRSSILAAIVAFVLSLLICYWMGWPIDGPLLTQIGLGIVIGVPISHLIYAAIDRTARRKG